MHVGYRTFSARTRAPRGAPSAPSALIAFEIEVLTETGQQARYTALASSSCAALLAALETWGLAKISVAPRRRHP